MTATTARPAAAAYPAEGVLGGAPRSPAFWALAAYVALFVIRPWEKVFPWMAAVPIERIAALGALGVMASCGRLRADASAQTLAYLGFLLALGASTAAAHDVGASIDRYYVSLTLFVLYVMLTSAVTSAGELAWLLLWWIAVMWAYLAKALWEFRSGLYHFRMGVVRMVGIESTFGSPNELAAAVAFTLPALLFCYTRRAAFGRAWRPAVLLLLGSYAAMAAATIVLTNSRSGILKVAFLGGVVALGGRGLRRKAAVVAAALAAAAVVWVALPEENRNRIRTIWDSEAGPANATASANSRIEGLYAGLEMFRARPLTGVGPGNFIAYRVQAVDGVDLEAHNLPGQALGVVGLVGTAAFLAMVAVTWVNCGRALALARAGAGPGADLAAGAAVAARRTLLLLGFSGLSGHNLFLYHWVWCGAFALIALRAARLGGPGR